MDPRQRRTRDRLYNTALDLAAATPVTDLTVTEIARQAQVHRSTFYEHAGSPFELLEQALVAELDEVRNSMLADPHLDPAKAVTEVTTEVLRHVQRHAAIYRRGLGEGSGAASLHAMLSKHFRISARWLLDVAGVRIDVVVAGVPDEAVVDAASRFLADGTVGLLEGWLLRDELDVDRFMRLYVALLPAWWPRELVG
jgi:AcrR family transcriptional regulator